MAKQNSSKKIFTKIEDSRVSEKRVITSKPNFFMNKEKFYKNLKKIIKFFPSKLFDKGI